ncbi:MAG TPA: hypothetical protein VFC47_02705 [Caulobacteraceae bacterium]|nr:hypothetical protein [Caulobacteraceae bacterium]
MAENRLLGGVLGGNDGPAEGEPAVATASLDAAAGAMAMEAAKTDPALAAEASAYFRDQAALVRLQAEHLHEQREVQLSHLKLRRLGERMRLAFQAFFILIGTGLAVGVLVMAWDAEHDHGLVVEAFSAPPDLAARGLTGQVIAKQVLDNLVTMQRQTASNRDPGSYSNNWGEALKVEIPETGVSLGEFRQYLHTWLGHHRGPDLGRRRLGR